MDYIIRFANNLISTEGFLFLLAFFAGLISFIEKIISNKKDRKSNFYTVFGFIFLFITIFVTFNSAINTKELTTQNKKKQDSLQAIVDSVQKENHALLKKISDTTFAIIGSARKLEHAEARIINLQDNLTNYATGGPDTPSILTAIYNNKSIGFRVLNRSKFRMLDILITGDDFITKNIDFSKYQYITDSMLSYSRIKYQAPYLGAYSNSPEFYRTNTIPADHDTSYSITLMVQWNQKYIYIIQKIAAKENKIRLAGKEYRNYNSKLIKRLPY